MASFLADVRHSFRVLKNSPGFTLIALLALALGIGANTAIFSVVDRVLLRPLPFRDSERIMRVERHFPNGNSQSTSIPRFMAWQRAKTFQSMAAYDFGSVSMNLGSGDRPDPVSAIHATAGFFDVFGAKPFLGRTFSPEEDLPDAGKFAVVTFPFWKSRLAADPGIAGKTILLNSERYVVLGVLEEGYHPDPPADLYVPEQFDPNSANQGNIYLVAGRLRPGVAIASANAELKVIAEQFRVAHTDIQDPSETTIAMPLRVAIGGDVRLALLVLTGAVGFVLLIACANVANLLLARAAARQREIAVRTALGASRSRIIRQLLTESVILAIAGAATGVLLAAVGVHTLLAFSPGDIPRINDPEFATGAISMLDWRILAFSLGVALLTGVLFGLFPAIQVSRLDVNTTLKESSGRSGSGRQNRVRGMLVIGEIALAVVLLAGAALMIRTFAGLRSVNPGLDPSGVLTLKTALSGSRYASTARVANMVRQASDRIESLPGVQFAACALVLPMDSAAIDLPFSIDGRAPKINGKWEGDEQWRFVSPHYFEALRIPLLRGRLFDQRDAGTSERVVIVNQEFAKKYWANQDPTGQRVIIGKGLGPDFDEPARQIIGIVGNVTETGLGAGAVPVMYVPQSQVTDGLTKLANGLLPMSWVIRSQGDPLSETSAVRHEFETLDAQLAPSKILTMDQVIVESTARQNFNMLLLTVFAGVALLLAAIGIYGLMSYAVQQRTQEIGIRMALGAGRGTVIGLILRQGVLLTGIGLVLGLAAAYGLTRVLAGLLFGVKATDPLTFSMVAAILTAVAIVAALVPARRAMRVDPIQALRHE